MRVIYTEKGRFPNPLVSYMIAPCWHCIEPVCVEACPAGAIIKRKEDGIVFVDSDACLGNTECDEKCLKACPYDAPQFGPEKGAKMRKCNYCLDRFAEGSFPTVSRPARSGHWMPGRLANWKKSTANPGRLKVLNIPKRPNRLLSLGPRLDAISF